MLSAARERMASAEVFGVGKGMRVLPESMASAILISGVLCFNVASLLTPRFRIGPPMKRITISE
jgi:hypothetical protein